MKERATRYAIGFDVKVRIGSEIFVGRTRNVSAGGLCVHVKTAPAGEVNGVPCDVTMSLTFPEEKFAEEIVINGSIVWVTKLVKQYQLGVRYGELDSQTQHRLHMCLGFLGEGDDDDESDDDY